VRGPLPPFFGSSAEAQKAEVVLVQPGSPGGSMMLPPTPQPAKAAANGQAGPANPAPVAGQADGQRNGAASTLFGPVISDAKIAAGSAGPHTHALEAMVAEMLRPMLQRWLDENMPRLVAAALQDEAVRMAVRDQNKV
jgi:cell pole-organizing protein PopZ